MIQKKIAVAFSGGLDTTYCVAWLKETTNAEIVTVTVDTGGFTEAQVKAIEKRSHEAGATRHITIDGRTDTFNRVVKHLISGNVLRGGVYPLCVSAERIVQAEALVKVASEIGSDAIAHGSTGAGNDQVRFDVAIRTLASETQILTPIRDQKLARKTQTDWLVKRGIKIDARTTTYSVNAGMWGTTIGGGTIHDSWSEIPDSAYPTVVRASEAPDSGTELVITFDKGIPISLGTKKYSGPALVEELNKTGAEHGVGRGIHLGDTILGIKGRIAFEAPAATILITAHRELEKLVLTKWQQFWKDKMADFYGMLLHEALFYDPVARDIEAMIESSQSRVTGEVKLSLKKGIIAVQGVRSAHSILDAASATYGETQSLWDGRDAEGFTKIYGLQGRLAKMAGAARSS